MMATLQQNILIRRDGLNKNFFDIFGKVNTKKNPELRSLFNIYDKQYNHYIKNI